MFVHFMLDIHSFGCKKQAQTQAETGTHSNPQKSKNKNWTKNDDKNCQFQRVNAQKVRRNTRSSTYIRKL